MSLITLNVDSKYYHVRVNQEETLLHVLRQRLNIGSAISYCETGICGNCSVLYNGVPRQVCRIKAKEANHAKIVTLPGNLLNASQPKLEVECSGLCLTL